MKRSLVMIPLFLAAGCLSSSKVGGDDGGAGGDDGGGFAFNGGTLAVNGCGYSLTTKDQAEAPVLGSALLGPDPTPWAIHLGFVGDPSTSMVISWRTKDEKTLATTVQYGQNGMADKSIEGLTFSYTVPNQDPVRMHQGHLCGLLPGTTYSYRVGGKDKSGNEKWSATYTFRTAPDRAQAGAPIVLAVIGDTRGGYDTWGKMLAQVQTVATPDLILFSGDAVTLGPLQSEWDAYFQKAEPVLRQIPMISAHGNHDVNSVNYYSQFPLPGDQEDYSFDYGAAHIVVLNDTPQDATDIQVKAPHFLDQDLTAHATAPWKVLLHHRPMYSSAAAHGSDLTLLNTWGPIVDSHKVDLVINGHDHDYERSKPMRAQKPQASPADGTTFVVAGSAGAPLYDSGTSGFTALSKSTYNFAIVKLGAKSFDMKAYDAMGAVIDTLSYSK